MRCHLLNPWWRGLHADVASFLGSLKALSGDLFVIMKINGLVRNNGQGIFREFLTNW